MYYNHIRRANNKTIALNFRATQGNGKCTFTSTPRLPPQPCVTVNKLSISGRRTAFYGDSTVHADCQSLSTSTISQVYSQCEFFITVYCAVLCKSKQAKKWWRLCHILTQNKDIIKRIPDSFWIYTQSLTIIMNQLTMFAVS